MLKVNAMKVAYVSFIANKRQYLVRESSIVNRWSSLHNSTCETIMLSNGSQMRASKIKRFEFIDIASSNDALLLPEDVEFDF